MDKTLTIPYLDRSTGRLRTESVYAGGFLRWLYNTLTGRLASYLLFSHTVASRLYGFWTTLPQSRRQIAGLVKSGAVAGDDLPAPADGYASFNDFFTRRIDLSRRPMPTDESVCIAPVDGKVLAYSGIAADETFQIKSHSFNLATFLTDPDLVRRFDGGSMIICRLSLGDYHHFHFPDGGWPGKSREIAGRLHAGGPYAEGRLLPYYARNRRALTPFLADHYGLMLIAEVGALTVGSIVQHYRPGSRVRRGDTKGHFELGGSTVVLLFQAGAIRIDNDLLTNTASGLETRVRMGDSLGRASCHHSYPQLLEEVKQ